MHSNAKLLQSWLTPFMEMWGLPTKWDPCEDGSCYLFSLSWSKGILSMWVSTVMAELATRGFPRDTWLPGASLCSSKWLCCVGFSCLLFPNLMLVFANHSVGHHSPSHRDGKPKGRCWSAFTNCIARTDNTRECPSVSPILFFSPSVWRKKCWWSRSGMVSSHAPGSCPMQRH